MAAPRKITVTRRETSTIRQNDGQGGARTIEVEVRRRRVFVKNRAAEAMRAEIEAQAKAQLDRELKEKQEAEAAEAAKREAEAKRAAEEAAKKAAEEAAAKKAAEEKAAAEKAAAEKEKRIKEIENEITYKKNQIKQNDYQITDLNETRGYYQSLLSQALSDLSYARSNKTKVYIPGIGWTYQVNQNAISAAEARVENYKSYVNQCDLQLSSLNESNNILKQEIESLEKEKEQIRRNYYGINQLSRMW